jgi:hypothetical protein
MSLNQAQASSSSCLDFFLNKFLFGLLSLYKRSSPRSPFHTPRHTTLFPLVFVCSRWCLSLFSGLFRPSISICSPSGSGSDAPDSSGSSSWRYIVATFPSFRRSTAKHLSYFGILLLARLIVYLNFMTTIIWSESMFTTLRAFSSIRSDKCYPAIKQWSIWLRVPGEFQISRWILFT